MAFPTWMLLALGLGQVQQPVRVTGVAAAQIRHPEGQPVPGRALFHLPLRLAGLLQRHAVLAGQQLHGRRVRPRQGRRVQFEGAVGDLHLAAVRELLQRPLEVPLAQVTPWAHNVRPDFNLHRASQLPALPRPSRPEAIGGWRLSRTRACGPGSASARRSRPPRSPAPLRRRGARRPRPGGWG